MTPAAADFVDVGSEPFGTFGEVDYLVYRGCFQGSTGNGDFRVPFEIVAPATPSLGNGSVVVEASHFFFGLQGRDFVLSVELLFGQGFAHAGVGWSSFGLSLLDPSACDIVIAGQQVAGPTPPGVVPIEDSAIVAAFARALRDDAFALEALGPLERSYAYGGSQTAQALQRVFFTGEGDDLFDLTVLHVDVWRPAFGTPQAFAELPEEFEPLSGIGRVIFVGTEGDQLISGSEQFRRAVEGPGADPDHYRVYEVAGAPHFAQPPPLNPLGIDPIARAALVLGDAWVRFGEEPPTSRLLAEAPAGEIDPFYGFETGIARDADGNALGGVRFPDVEAGRALFIASLLDVEAIPGSGLFGLLGAWQDLACAPRPGASDDEPRFRDHGAYVRAVVQQLQELQRDGLLLPADAEVLRERAAASDVGRPGSCPTAVGAAAEFTVRSRWSRPDGSSGFGRVVSQSEQSVLFWFFSPDNWELLVKVLDGCALNGHHWVVVAAGTDVEHGVEVTNASTGARWERAHSAGAPAPTWIDTEAFPCGPPSGA